MNTTTINTDDTFVSNKRIWASRILAGLPMDFFEFKPGAFVGALGGLTEIILGIWLIVKGFDEGAGNQKNPAIP